MENPFKAVQLKFWPDFLLVASGGAFLLTLSALAAGEKTTDYVLLFGGVFVFGLGAKKAHYRYRDSKVRGNANAWFSGWRHDVISDCLAVLGVLLVLLSIARFLNLI